MANNRAAIRTALKNLLLGQTDADQSVFTNRDTPLSQSELPAIIIYSNQETSTPLDLRSRRLLRELELTIEVKVESASTIDDTLDALVAQIENRIDTDASLGGTVQSAIIINTEIRIDSEGEKDIGIAALTLQCKYIS